MAIPLQSMAEDQRFRLLVDGVSDQALYLVDQDGFVVSWNSGAEHISGFAPDDVVGQSHARFFPDKERRRGAPEKALALAAQSGRHDSEGWRLRKDGSSYWAQTTLQAIRDDNGEVSGFAAISRDMTQRRAAQQALIESEQQFRRLVSGVTDYAIFMLDPNGVITNWNTGAERIKGYKAEEIVGHHFSKFYNEVDRKAGVPARALGQAASEGRFDAEGWRVRKDGSQFWASVVIDAIRDEQGTLVGFAKITRDITERRKAQEDLQRAQEHLAHTQKMEALGHLTGGVAHDFNNLLMIVGGQADLIKRRGAADPHILASAEAIEAATLRGESLTRQLLSFARRQQLTAQVIDLRERMDGVTKMLSGSLGPQVQLHVGMPTSLWTVEVDPNELELALLNVVVNARDAMPDGGVVTVRAENRHLGLGDADGTVEGDFVAVIVTDTGVGIPADVLPRVFDPFFSTKAADKGTGLGLSQVHGFAHQTGGAVTIASDVGAGTQIIIYLPRAEGAPSQKCGDATPSSEAHGPGKVMLVEDNPEVASTTASMLDQLGYDIRIMSEPQAVLQALQDDAFDLLLSDVVMPGPMDGLALARAVRFRHPELPILLATGYTSAEAAARNGFTLLRKPYRLSDLSRAIAAVTRQGSGNGANLVPFPVGRSRPEQKTPRA
jgi:PAS domain S-box-containing protein